jgi:hypothetical protein
MNCGCERIINRKNLRKDKHIKSMFCPNCKDNRAEFEKVD